MTEHTEGRWLAKHPDTKKHLGLKIALALLPAVIFFQNYAWMTGNAYLGWASLIIWAVMIWSALQLGEKNSILERMFRLTEVSFFLLPISALILTFVIGSRVVGGSGSDLEQAGAAIGTAIGGAFVVGIGFVIGIAGGIIMHLVASKYEKKAEASGVKQQEVLSNKHGVILAIAAVFLLAVVLGSVASAKSHSVAEKEKENLQAGGTSQPAETTPENKGKIGLELTKKGFRVSDWQSGIYEDQITITLKFTNETDKDVKGVEGTLIYYDIFGNQITATSISYDKGIPAKGSKLWDAVLDYNQFDDEDVKLRSTNLEDLKFKWEIDTIVYADGSTEDL